MKGSSVTTFGRMLLIVATITFAVGACRRGEPPPAKATGAARPTVAVDFALVEARPLQRAIDVTGTLVADAQADVAAEVAGRVMAVMIERGTRVTAGAVLARLDDRDATNQLREAEAAAAQAAARVTLSAAGHFDPDNDPEVQKVRLAMEQMKTDDERYARLAKEGAVSVAESESRHIQYLSAKEEYRAAQQRAHEAYQALLTQRTRLATARKAVADTTIQAPFDGVVAEKHVNVGQFLQRGGRIATVVRVDPLRIELMVPEVATVAVKRAEKVSFSVQAYPDRRFDGRVKYLGPSLRSDSRALVAEAIVPNPEGLLHPGFFATARIELGTSERALFVPVSAVQTDAAGSKLFVIRDGRAEQRFVQVGRHAGDQVEIVRGLAAGERVATTGLDQLGDGVPVSERAR
jgi:RND family efflux transporter MFP subunit